MDGNADSLRRSWPKHGVVPFDDPAAFRYDTVSIYSRPRNAMPDEDNYPETQPPQRQDLKARKGRGAVSNLQGRYEKQAREGFDDGWLHADEGANGGQAQKLKTY